MNQPEWVLNKSTQLTKCRLAAHRDKRKRWKWMHGLEKTGKRTRERKGEMKRWKRER